MMTHMERKERRQQIAAFAADGMTVVEICSEFSVSSGTVETACREFGVRCQLNNKRHAPPGFVYKVVAYLQNTDLSLSEIGRRLSLSRQRIHQIYCAAKEGGIHFHNRTEGENQ